VIPIPILNRSTHPNIALIDHGGLDSALYPLPLWELLSPLPHRSSVEFSGPLSILITLEMKIS